MLSLSVAAAVAGLAHHASAASSTWTGGGSSSWSDPINWGGSVPGATSGTTNTDLATFNLNAAPLTIAIDPDRNIKGIVFDTSAGAFVIGGAGANAGNALLLTSGGSISIASTFSGSGVTETLNAPLVLEPVNSSSAGVYTLANNSSNTANVLDFAGGISGGTTSSTETLTINGAAPVTFTGPISDGAAAGGLVLQYTGAATSILNLPNANTYTGGTTLNGLGSGGASTSTVNVGNNTAFGTGDITFANGNLSASTPVSISNPLIISQTPTLGHQYLSGSQPITFNGSVTGDAPNLQNYLTNSSTTPVTLNGNLYINGPGQNGNGFFFQPAGPVTVNGVISDIQSGSASGKLIIANGTGVVALNAANTFTGGAYLGGGATVVIGNAGAFGPTDGVSTGLITTGINPFTNLSIGVTSWLAPAPRTVANPLLVYNQFQISTLSSALTLSGTLQEVNSNNNFSNNSTSLVTLSGTVESAPGALLNTIIPFVNNQRGPILISGPITDNPDGSVTQLVTQTQSPIYFTNSHNTFSGGIDVKTNNSSNAAGALNFTSLSALGQGGLKFDGGVMQWATNYNFGAGGDNGDISSLSGNQGITNQGIGFDTNGNNVTFNSPLTDNGSGGAVIKLGAGTLTLAGANSFANLTAVEGGALVVPASATINATNRLRLAAGTLVIGSGQAGISFLSNGLNLGDARFNTTNEYGEGAASIVAPALANGTATIALGPIARIVGATIDFTQLPTVGHITTTTANTNGILGGYATVAGTDWAANDGSGNITALSAGSYTNDTWSGATANVTVTGNSAQASGSSANSLRFNATGSAAVTLSGTNILTSGGILVTGAVGNNATSITGGTLEGKSATDLVVIQDNNSGANSAFTISSVIANNGSATGLTKAGPGSLILTNANTFTGQTTVLGGTLELAGGSSIASAGGSANTNGVNIFGGTLTVDPGASLASSTDLIVGALNNQPGYTLNAPGTANFSNSAQSLYSLRGIGTLNLNGTALTITAGNGGFANGGYWSGVINGTGSLTLTGGTLVLAGYEPNLAAGNATPIANGYTGGTTINGSTAVLNFSALNQLGTGSITLSNGGALQWGGSGDDISGRTVTLGSGGGILDTNGRSVTFSNPIGNNGAGGLTKISAGTLILNGANTYTGDTVVKGGVLELASGNIASTNVTVDTGIATLSTATSLNVDAGAALSTSANLTVQQAVSANFANSTQTIATLNGAGAVSLSPTALTVTGGGTFSGSITGPGSLNVSGSTLALSGTNDAYTGGTTISGGTLLLSSGAWNTVLSSASGANITHGRIIFDYTNASSPASLVKSLLTTAAASNFASGQLRSSTATAKMGLGWKDDTSARQVTVAYTYDGDADLNGIVDTNDFDALAANYNTTNATWAQGDFNYDGTVNALDFNALATNYGAPSLAAPAAEAPMLGALVPEPTTLAIISLALPGLWSRRRARANHQR